MSKAAQKEDTPEVIETIHPQQMNQMQFAHQVWSVITPNALTIKQLENPKTWAFSTSKFRLHDRIEVMAGNGSQLSKGIVTYVRGNQIKIQIYEHYKLHEQKYNEIDYDGFLIKWGGAHQNWIIQDKETGDILKGDFPTDQNALAYLKDHFKSLNIHL